MDADHLEFLRGLRAQMLSLANQTNKVLNNLERNPVSSLVVVEFNEHEPLRVYGLFKTEEEANSFGVNTIGIDATDSAWCVYDLFSPSDRKGGAA